MFQNHERNDVTVLAGITRDIEERAEVGEIAEVVRFFLMFFKGHRHSRRAVAGGGLEMRFEGILADRKQFIAAVIA